MNIADTVYPLPSRYLETAAGLTLAYTNAGQGFPLLFLHGLGSYFPAWKKNIAALSSHYQCLAPDLPGFGKSSKEGITPGMHFWTEVVNEFLDQLGIEQCHLVGHSMGGQVAMHLANRFPARIRKLSLIAPAGLETFTPPEAQQLKAWFSPVALQHAPLSTTESAIRANFHHFPQDAQQLVADRLHYTHCSDYPRFCQHLSEAVAAMLNEPVFPLLPHLKMPVQVIFGRQDRYIPNPLLHPDLPLEVLVREAAAQLPDVQLHFLDRCGHFAQWEQAKEVNRLLLEFLSN